MFQKAAAELINMFWIFLLFINSATAEFDPRNVSMENWTSCDEFLRNYTHDIDKIVDVDWKIFYFWEPTTANSYNVRFSKPSVGLVDRYRVELAKELKDVNWTEAELFMETAIDFSALYLRTNVTGLYRIIPSLAFDMPNCPYMAFALKVVEPGYLGIMNCKQRYAFALAPVDKMPHNDHLAEAAARLMFQSPLGRSHLTRPKPVQQTYEEDDIDDDEMELERRFNSI